MFLAKIVAVNVREDLVDEKGLHLDRTGLVSYAHGHYYVLGKEIGKFGYSVQKKTARPSPKEKSASAKKPSDSKKAPAGKKTSPGKKRRT